jgi:hypothetical protein
MNLTFYNDPWKHLVIDDLLDPETFKRVEQYVLKFKDIKTHTLEKHTMSTKSEMYDLLADMAISLKDKYFDELNFGNRVLPKIYYPVIEFNVCPPGFKWHKIHTDIQSKLMSNVLYISPDVSSGTELYKKQNDISIAKEVEWKKNRVFCFVSQSNTMYPSTWHNYKNNTKVNRISVNLNLCSDEYGDSY